MLWWTCCLDLRHWENVQLGLLGRIKQRTNRFLWRDHETDQLFDVWYIPFQWRHNGRDSVSNHQPHDCMLSRLFRRRSKTTLKLRVTGLCAGNRMAWQWAETLVEIRGTLADIRGTTKLGWTWNFPKHEFNKPVCLEAHHYSLAHLSQ